MKYLYLLLSDEEWSAGVGGNQRNQEKGNTD